MTPFTLNIKGKIITVDRPLVMGIVNVTDDSFYSASRMPSSHAAAEAASRMAADGADIIDVGGCSTRPGAVAVDPDIEIKRVVEAIEHIKQVTPPDVLLSVDTFRAEVAREAVAAGADIVNDISAGALDPDMFQTIARLGVPYILTHSGALSDETVQACATDPTAVASAVVSALSEKLHLLQQLGVADVIIDPGFGFSKTVEQNYQLLANLSHVSRLLGKPLLVGLSRKSMITQPCGISADDALAGTTALNTSALLSGADILRVHDVAAARQTITVVELLRQATIAHPNH